MRLPVAFLCLGLLGCVRTRVVTVPIKVADHCLGDLGPPPNVPDLSGLENWRLVDYIEDLTIYSRRVWARCGEGALDDQ